MTFFNTNLPNDGKINKISLNDLTEKNVNDEVSQKFLNYYTKNVAVLNFFGYDKIFEKFRNLIEKNKTSLNIENFEELKSESSDLNKKVKIQREKKERTSKPDIKLEKKTNSQKKRSAVAAGISVIYEENESDTNQSDSNKPKDSNVVTKVQKVLKKLNRQANLDETSDLNQAYIQTMSSIDVNPQAKKFRPSDVQETDNPDIEQAENAKLKKKPKTSKSKKSKKSKLSDLGKSLKNDESNIENNKYKFNVTDVALLDIKKATNPNTPLGQTPFKPKLTNNNDEKKSQNKTQIMSTQTPYKPAQAASKSEKKIAVKALDFQVKPANQNDLIKTLKPANRVKKIVETIESKVSKLASNLKFLPFSKNQKKSVHSIIDNRKKKTSMSKPEIKRKSIKQVDAFLKDLAQEQNKLSLTDGKKLEPSSFNTVILNPKSSNLNKSIYNAKALLQTPGIKNSFSAKKKLDVSRMQKEYAEKSIMSKNSDRITKTQPKTNVYATPIGKKIELNGVTTTIVKPNKNKANEQITYESLRYDQGKLNNLKVYENEYQTSCKLKNYGSTSTISTISSLGSASSASTVLLANKSNNSFKTVDTTFDNTTNTNNHSESNQFKNKSKFDFKINQQTVVINKDRMQDANQGLEAARALTDKFKANFTPSLKKTNINTPLKTPFKTPLKTPMKLKTETKTNSVHSTITLLSTTKKLNDIDRTPSKALDVKLNKEDYGISELRSEDETDDEEQPNKPIPEWAKNANILNASLKQAHNYINFTDLFKAATRAEINLEQIFKTKKQKYYQRSSSAIWQSPPVWGNGLNGDESFKKTNIY